MWKILRPKNSVALIIAAFALSSNSSLAQSLTNNNTQNYGFNLPSPPMPNGFDEVRTSEGMVCRSSMANNGAYLDIGGLGGQNNMSGNVDATLYGRLIIPLGKKPKRIDCSSLYQLEIERLRLELKMAQSGMVSNETTGSVPKTSSNWQTQGWNNQ